MDIAEIGYWVCASYEHLKAYTYEAPNMDEYEVTILAGQAAGILNAVRGRTLVSVAEVLRVARAKSIGKIRLDTQILSSIERLRSPRVDIRRTASGQIHGIEEHLATPKQLFEFAGAFWESLDPSIVERAAVYVLQHTCALPRLRTDELMQLTKEGMKDEQAEHALGVIQSFEIVRSFSGPGLDEPILFNEYVWRKDHKKIAHAIARFDSKQREAVGLAITTASKWQGLPLERLDADPELITDARSVGLLDIVTVHAADGRAREFAFTPLLTTHPDHPELADDLLNDVRAVLACVGYGENYSRISRLGGVRRDKTINFLRKLLRNGRAGDATAIGVDYQLLEERGIITVEATPTPPSGRHAMVLLRSEPIEIALRVIEDSTDASLPMPRFVHTRDLDPASLFSGPEQTRTSLSPTLAKQPAEVKEARNHFLQKIRKEVF